MPANPRHQTAQPPPSPTIKASSRYTNKDGSKFISIPKTSAPTSSSETSPTMAQTNMKSSAPPAETTTVNRKKQKRREKQAAKLAAEQSVANGVNGRSGGANSQGQAHPRYGSQFHEGDAEGTDDEDRESGSWENDGGSPYNRHAPESSSKNSKKKKKGRPANSSNSANSHIPPPPPPPPPESSTNPRPGMTKEKIWNTSSAEERERIKEFWLSLGEDERKSLVKVEKDAVLKKMKEQQKHSCSCTVCGRKRLAIEEELEVLYDAYYSELESYANNCHGDPPPMLRPRRLGAVSGLHSPHQLPPAFHPSRGRIENPGEEDLDEDGEEEYSEEDEDLDEYSEDEPPEATLPENNFFNFGNSLTVKGGILTVADDLLKNDGKKFIEMMEQLAERRMQREEDAERQFASGGYHPNGGIPNHHHSHASNNHPPPPPPEEEYDDDRDPCDYDSEEEEEEEEEDYDDEDEDDEMDTMTEDQRMEEGRRMFQIFAARMFEQRVLTAYKEKVAKERQQKLFEEIDEEKSAEQQRKNKKAKEAQKRKEKNQQKKQALAEEKAKREAEEAEKAAVQQAIEEKKAEEHRLRQEEKRKKREAQKKAEEEERLRKEADKQKRIVEQRERQAELERKQRETKEREKKEKEEARQKALEAKETKEREARERKERQENERKDKEAKAREAQKQAEKQKKLDEQAAQAEREEARKKSAAQHVPPASHQPPKPRLPQQPISIPMPPGLQPHPLVSPQIQVAMPILPKAPTPVRPRDMSHVAIPQTPQFGAVGKSQDNSPAPSTPQQSSPSVLGSGNRPYLHHPQATSPIHAALRGSPGPVPMHQGMPAGMHLGPMNGFPPGPPLMNQMYPPGRMPGFDPMFGQPLNNQYRPPPGMPLHAPLPAPQGRGYPYAPPGFAPHPPAGSISNILQSFSPSKENAPNQSHSRNVSGSFENGFPPGLSMQPIAKPTPIARPSSVVHGQRPGSNHRSENKDIDELSKHLGSSALLDDDDVAFCLSRRQSVNPRGGRFPTGGSFMEHQSSPYGSWPHSTNPFGGSSLPGAPTWGGNMPDMHGASGWAQPLGNVFNSNNNSSIRTGRSAVVTVRLALCKACKTLAPTTPDGFIEMGVLRQQVAKILGYEPPAEAEILDICETEGNTMNGGGVFNVRSDTVNDINYITYDPGDLNEGRPNRSVGAPGEIGSPIVGSGNSHFGRSGGGSGGGGGFGGF